VVDIFPYTSRFGGYVTVYEGHPYGKKSSFYRGKQHYFYHLEWLDNVEDIREQFPLFEAPNVQSMIIAARFRGNSMIPKNIWGICMINRV
jgi:hypothetical protein